MQTAQPPPAAPPAGPASSAQPNGGGAAKEPLGASTRPSPGLAVSSKGCTHTLKLRDSFRVGDRTRLELGLDFSLCGDVPQLLRSAQPWVALQRQLGGGAAKGRATVRADLHHLSLSKRFALGRRLPPLDAKLGLTYEGKPHAAVGFGSPPLTLALAAALLAAGKPVHIAHREVGGLALHFPLSFGGVRHEETLQERLELDATLRRRGWRLHADVHQVNAVVRLRED